MRLAILAILLVLFALGAPARWTPAEYASANYGSYR